MTKQPSLAFVARKLKISPRVLKRRLIRMSKDLKRS